MFHGAINGLIFVNHAAEIVERWWLSAAVYGLLAACVVIGGGLGVRPTSANVPRDEVHEV